MLEAEQADEAQERDRAHDVRTVRCAPADPPGAALATPRARRGTTTRLFEPDYQVGMLE
jgi:hypothetical protein